MPRYGLDYLGMEVEVCNIPQHILGQTIDRALWRIEHDASVESDSIYIQTNQNNNGLMALHLPIVLARNFQTLNSTVGGEIVLAPPYPFEEGVTNLLESFKRLTYKLQELGEPERGTRNSIHYHISMPYSLKVLKTILKLGGWLEDVFYYIGGQGYTFRGELANNSAYCRPITKCGPPCTREYSSRQYVQVFTIDDLLRSSNSKDFWYRFGNSSIENNVERYHPARYTWLNLYSLLAHGTLEFRAFNFTLNPFFMFAEASLCKAFCDTVMHFSWSKENKIKDLTINSIYDKRNKGDIIETLLSFCELADSEYLSQPIIDTLVHIIEMTPKISLQEGLVRTHLTERVFSRVLDYSNLPYSVETYHDTVVDEVIVQDIHTLRGERR